MTLRCFFALLPAALLFQLASPCPADPLLTYSLRIKGHVLRAEVANDEDSRRTGLMYRNHMGENTGMLFIYEAEDRHAMWMKNTLIPLSVAFIDRRGRIINIEDMEPQTEDAHGAHSPAAYALEVNQGWFKKRGVKAGDKVEGLEKVPKNR